MKKDCVNLRFTFAKQRFVLLFLYFMNMGVITVAFYQAPSSNKEETSFKSC